MTDKKTRRQARFDAIPGLVGIEDVDRLIDELRRCRREVTIQPWMVDQLADAERSIKRYRQHLEALLAESPRTCAGCRQPISGRSDRLYCSDKCRIKAHLRRKARSSTDRAV